VGRIYIIEGQEIDNVAVDHDRFAHTTVLLVHSADRGSKSDLVVLRLMVLNGIGYRPNAPRLKVKRMMISRR
jgi:hypothetical protein